MQTLHQKTAPRATQVRTSRDEPSAPRSAPLCLVLHIPVGSRWAGPPSDAILADMLSHVTPRCAANLPDAEDQCLLRFPVCLRMSCSQDVSTALRPPLLLTTPPMATPPKGHRQNPQAVAQVSNLTSIGSRCILTDHKGGHGWRLLGHILQLLAQQLAYVLLAAHGHGSRPPVPALVYGRCDLLSHRRLIIAPSIRKHAGKTVYECLQGAVTSEHHHAGHGSAEQLPVSKHVGKT